MKRIGRGPLAEASPFRWTRGQCTCGECRACLLRNAARRRASIGRRNPKYIPFADWSRARQKVWFETPKMDIA